MSDATEKKINRIGAVFAKVWDRSGVWLACILLFMVLSFSAENFLSSSNIINIIRQICVNGIVALGATFVVLCGDIDLSQGSFVALIGCFCAWLMAKAGYGVLPAIAISLLGGCLIGLFAGLIVSILQVPSFIATLGLMYALAGGVLLLTNSQPISGLPDAFLKIGRGYAGIIPISVILLLVMFAIGAFVLKYTSFGRNVLAVGENRIAAALSGINVVLTKILVFVIAGFCSALGGIVLSSRLASGQPSSGSDVSLLALAGVFVGGASRGSVLNTLAGTLIIGMINNGLNLMEVNASWQKVALGFIIIAAVALDVTRSLKIAKKRV